jgi:hypothetical protein
MPATKSVEGWLSAPTKGAIVSQLASIPISLEYRIRVLRRN